MAGGVWKIQSNMNRGELDPRLLGRTDLQSYFNGVQTAKNVMSLVQGGMKRRPGMGFLGEALGDGRLFNFSFNVEQNYLLVFTALKMQVYKEGVLQTNINGSGNDYLVTPYAFADLQNVDYIQSADTAVIVHEDFAPQVLTRTSDTAWAIAALTITNQPQFNFSDGSNPTPVDEIQTLAFTAAAEGDRYKLGLGGIITDEAIAYSLDTTTNETNIRDGLLSLPNTPNTDITVAHSAGTTYTVTFTDTAAEPWDFITGSQDITASTTFKITTARTQVGTTKKEDVWSVTRGWPRTATFHEARLWFGGSTSRPQTMWGSRVNDFFNFDKGRGRDDESIDVTLDTDQVNAINGIISNRNLQVFTSGAEFYVPASPITPSDVAFAPQTSFGAKKVRPVTVDGQTIYIQRTGKSLRQFQFLNDTQAYESSSVSILASHLIKNPIALAVAKGTETVDASYAYILGDTGELAVYNTLASEDISAFTQWISGDMKSVTVVDDRLNVLVKRNINSVDKYFIEVEDEDLFLDSAIKATVNSDTLTGLDHLNGETVKVRADGSVQSDELVAGGSITIDRVAVDIEAGINYTPEIKTMPLSIDLKNGPNAALPKRVIRVGLNLFESLGVLVNGERIADKTMAVDVFNAPTPHTGFEEMFLLGWSVGAEVTITQLEPVPMTILSIAQEVGI